MPIPLMEHGPDPAAGPAALATSGAGRLPDRGVTLAGIIAAAIGLFWLVAWLTGVAVRWSAAGDLTVKTNMALAQLLGGVALLLFTRPTLPRPLRWAGLVAASLVLLIGALTLSEHLLGWNLGIDQLLAKEPPGALGTTSPNRMGLPGSSILILLGTGLFALAWRRPFATYLGVAICLLALFPLVGFVYEIEALYTRPGFTAIAWPSVIALMALGIGLVLSGSHTGPMSILHRQDAGARLFRQWLPALVLVPLLLGFLKMQAQHHGLIDRSLGTGLLILGLMLIFLALLCQSVSRLSRADRENAAKEAEARSVALFPLENPSPVLRVGPDGRLLFANRSAATLLSEWHVGPGDLAPDFLRNLAQDALRRGKKIEFEISLGDLSYCLVAAPILGRDYVNFYGLDITERKRAEAALRRSEERLTQAVRVGRLGTFEHDHLLGTLEYSPLMRDLMGFRHYDAISFEAFLSHVAPADRSWLPQAIAHAHDPAGDGVFSVECRMLTPDGAIRWVSIRSQTLFEGQGVARRPLRTIGAALDVTEQKESQQRLETIVAERTEKLREAVAELEHFSYTITHDMRAPLRAMTSFAQILLEPDPTAHHERAELLQRIKTSAERMDLLIRDALSYAKAVRHEMPLEPVDCGALVQGMLDSYPELHAARSVIAIEGPLPVVFGNKAGLTQCLSNLLGNAVKFADPVRPLTIRIRAEDHDTRVRLWVEDNGLGVSQDMLPKLFQMFARGHHGSEGTGIGLALVRKVMERMGGRVGVESEEGKGSRFWLELSKPAPPFEI